MMFDALLIFIISTTEFSYREDCKEVGTNTVAYHRITTHYEGEEIVKTRSHINVCKGGDKYEHIIHEGFHELHYRIRNTTDEKFLKYAEAFDILNEMSSDPEDYVSDYAMKNVNEDFADTLEFYYKNDFNIPERRQGDWIDRGVSNILVAKYQLAELIVRDYKSYVKEKGKDIEASHYRR